MFGDEFIDTSGRLIRICCGPRCGAEIEHRRIYAAIESVVAAANSRCAERAVTVHPAICQGFCGMGVTVVLPDSEWIKIRAASEVREKICISEDNETCPQ